MPEAMMPHPRNRVDEKTKTAVIQYAADFPAHGQQRPCNELRKQGLFVTGSGVRRVWLRHQTANFRNRLKTLERKKRNSIHS